MLAVGGVATRTGVMSGVTWVFLIAIKDFRAAYADTGLQRQRPEGTMTSSAHQRHAQPASAVPGRIRRTLASRLRHLAGSGDREFTRAFPALVMAVDVVFQREEFILERFRYPRLPERCAENAVILWALRQVAPLVEQGCIEAGRQAVAALDGILLMQRLGNALAVVRLRWRPVRSGRRQRAAGGARHQL
ncbi:hypothetical protein HAV22_04865 [Massilia sp. TW-1]|uniref:Uncharacterized protein n=1 Tax=Telluria antibiotica TaxID=2717319 RepID=A0ABX0P6V1_9BURK|nr:hypothetical protein [Telluria antibiotica]NIA52984.1 hypothetical protein [Telluria antibiotica]